MNEGEAVSGFAGRFWIADDVLGCTVCKSNLGCETSARLYADRAWRASIFRLREVLEHEGFVHAATCR